MQCEKCSKTQNACGAHLLNASLKRKNKQTTIPTSTAERARAVGMLQQYVSITLPVCIGHRSLNAGVRNAWRPENDEFSLVYRELRHLSAGDRDLSTFSEKKKRLICRLPAPSRSIPTALAPFSVVICRMMMQNVVCFFLLNETFSNDLWKKNCCKYSLASSACIFRFWALPALHVEFCWISE